MRNVLFVISGPSGVGKGTLVKALMKEDPSLALSVSCTTRAPRKGERDGVEYFFLTQEQFDRRIEEGDFLEYNNVFENSYGTPRAYVEEKISGHSVILEIEVEGGLRAAKLVREEGVYPVVLIMIVPPSIEVLMERLRKRGSETEAQIAKRRARIEYELSKINEYDYVVVNDDFDAAKRELESIIEAEINKD